MSQLPERINAIKVISYNVPDLVDTIVELNNGEITKDDVTLDELLDLVNGWADEDMTNAPNKIIYQDENGGEL